MKGVVDYDKSHPLGKFYMECKSLDYHTSMTIILT